MKQLDSDFKIELRYQSSQEWIDAVKNDFASFLADHADCERRAADLAMSFVNNAPENIEIIPELIDTALEELVHFRQVYKLMEDRDIQLNVMSDNDPYMNKLTTLCRSNQRENMLDRLMVAAMMETRGAERFKIVSEIIGDPDLQQFYSMLYKSEDKHGNIFLEMALTYFEHNEVFDRLDFFINKEAEVCKNLPIRSALH